MSALLHSLLQGRERAVQMDAHGRLGALEHPGDVVRGHVLLNPQENRRPLARSQAIDRRSQCLQRFLPAQLVDRIADRRRLPVEDRLASVVVVILNPELPPLVLALVVQTQVDQDPIEPRRELRATTKAPGHLVEPDEGLLRHVPCVLGVAEDGPGEAICPLLIARHEEVEGRLVSPGHALTERFVCWLHSPGVPSPFTLSLPTVPRQVSSRRYRLRSSCARSRRSWRGSRPSSRRSRTSSRRSRRSPASSRRLPPPSSAEASSLARHLTPS